MTSKRFFYLLCGLIVFLVVAIIGGAYGINHLFEKQARTLSDAKAKLGSLQLQQTQLIQSKKDIATYTDLYNISKTVVPQTKNQAQAVRQIVKLANQTGVSLQSITFPPFDARGWLKQYLWRCLG